MVETAPVGDAAWQRLSGLALPRQPLTAPLLALLHDASPRPHSQAKQPPVWPWKDSDWLLWQDSLDALLGKLDESRTVDDFLRGMNISRDLQFVLADLTHFQSF